MLLKDFHPPYEPCVIIHPDPYYFMITKIVFFKHFILELAQLVSSTAFEQTLSHVIAYFEHYLIIIGIGTYHTAICSPHNHD